MVLNILLAYTLSHDSKNDYNVISSVLYFELINKKSSRQQSMRRHIQKQFSPTVFGKTMDVRNNVFVQYSADTAPLKSLQLEFTRLRYVFAFLFTEPNINIWDSLPHCVIESQEEKDKWKLLKSRVGGVHKRMSSHNSLSEAPRVKTGTSKVVFFQSKSEDDMNDSLKANRVISKLGLHGEFEEHHFYSSLYDVWDNIPSYQKKNLELQQPVLRVLPTEDESECYDQLCRVIYGNRHNDEDIEMLSYYMELIKDLRLREPSNLIDASRLGYLKRIDNLLAVLLYRNPMMREELCECQFEIALKGGSKRVFEEMCRENYRRVILDLIAKVSTDETHVEIRYVKPERDIFGRLKASIRVGTSLYTKDRDEATTIWSILKHKLLRRFDVHWQQSLFKGRLGHAFRFKAITERARAKQEALDKEEDDDGGRNGRGRLGGQKHSLGQTIYTDGNWHWQHGIIVFVFVCVTISGFLLVANMWHNNLTREIDGFMEGLHYELSKNTYDICQRTAYLSLILTEMNCNTYSVASDLPEDQRIEPFRLSETQLDGHMVVGISMYRRDKSTMLLSNITRDQYAGADSYHGNKSFATYWLSRDFESFFEISNNEPSSFVPPAYGGIPFSPSWRALLDKIVNNQIDENQWWIWWSQLHSRPTIVNTLTCDNNAAFVLEIDIKHIINEFNRLNEASCLDPGGRLLLLTDDENFDLLASSHEDQDWQEHGPSNSTHFDTLGIGEKVASDSATRATIKFIRESRLLTTTDLFKRVEVHNTDFGQMRIGASRVSLGGLNMWLVTSYLEDDVMQGVRDCVTWSIFMLIICCLLTVILASLLLSVPRLGDGHEKKKDLYSVITCNGWLCCKKRPPSSNSELHTGSLVSPQGSQYEVDLATTPGLEMDNRAFRFSENQIMQANTPSIYAAPQIYSENEFNSEDRIKSMLAFAMPGKFDEAKSHAHLGVPHGVPMVSTDDEDLSEMSSDLQIDLPQIAADFAIKKSIPTGRRNTQVFKIKRQETRRKANRTPRLSVNRAALTPQPSHSKGFMQKPMLLRPRTTSYSTEIPMEMQRSLTVPHNENKANLLQLRQQSSREFSMSYDPTQSGLPSQDTQRRKNSKKLKSAREKKRKNLKAARSRKKSRKKEKSKSGATFHVDKVYHGNAGKRITSEEGKCWQRWVFAILYLLMFMIAAHETILWEMTSLPFLNDIAENIAKINHIRATSALEFQLMLPSLLGESLQGCLSTAWDIYEDTGDWTPAFEFAKESLSLSLDVFSNQDYPYYTIVAVSFINQIDVMDSHENPYVLTMARKGDINLYAAGFLERDSCEQFYNVDIELDYHGQPVNDESSAEKVFGVCDNMLYNLWTSGVGHRNFTTFYPDRFGYNDEGGPTTSSTSVYFDIDKPYFFDIDNNISRSALAVELSMSGYANYLALQNVFNFAEDDRTTITVTEDYSQRIIATNTGGCISKISNQWSPSYFLKPFNETWNQWLTDANTLFYQFYAGTDGTIMNLTHIRRGLWKPITFASQFNSDQALYPYYIANIHILGIVTTINNEILLTSSETYGTLASMVMVGVIVVLVYLTNIGMYLWKNNMKEVENAQSVDSGATTVHNPWELGDADELEKQKQRDELELQIMKLQDKLRLLNSYYFYDKDINRGQIMDIREDVWTVMLYDLIDKEVRAAYQEYMKKLDIVPENSEEKMPIRSKVILDKEYERAYSHIQRALLGSNIITEIELEGNPKSVPWASDLYTIYTKVHASYILQIILWLHAHHFLVKPLTPDLLREEGVAISVILIEFFFIGIEFIDLLVYRWVTFVFQNARENHLISEKERQFYVARVVFFSLICFDWFLNIFYSAIYFYFPFLRIVYLIITIPSMRQSMVLFTRGVLKAYHLLILYITFLAVYACMGTILFHDELNQDSIADSFATIVRGFLTSFILITTGENYEIIYLMRESQAPSLAFFYVLSAVVVGLFILISLLVAEFQESYSQAYERDREIRQFIQKTGIVAAFAIIDDEGKGTIMKSDWHDFIAFLGRKGEQDVVNLARNLKKKQVDVDGSGDISVVEFVQTVYTCLTIKPSKKSPPPVTTFEHTRDYLREKVVETKPFRKIVLLLVIMQSWVLCLYGQYTGKYANDTLDFFSSCFVFCNVLEIIFKIIVYGVDEYWNWATYHRADSENCEQEQFALRMDLVVVSMSVAALAGSRVFIRQLRIENESNWIRIVMVFPMLRCFTLVKRTRQAVYVVGTVMPQFTPLLGLNMLCLNIFVVWGVMFFSDVYDTALESTEAKFDTFGAAYLALIQMTIGEGWHSVMYAMINMKGIFYSVYFVAFILIMNLFFANLFLGLIISFNQAGKAMMAKQSELLEWEAEKEKEEITADYVNSTKLNDQTS